MKLDFFEVDDMLLLLGLFGFLGFFVLELPVIHDLAYGRFGIRSDLDQIVACVDGALERLRNGNNSQLLAVLTDNADLRYPYPVINTGGIFFLFREKRTSCVNKFLLG
jgi:hypothetical protein